MEIQDIKQNVEVKMTDSINLGRCYNQYYYKITSSVPLSYEHFKMMWNAGMIGYGHGWGFQQNGQDPLVEHDANGKPSYIYKTYSTVRF